jgi:uncharacterized membrane protein YoaK (UPF0700 family)
MRRLLHDTDRLHMVLMLALTFSTGIVDAVGYLGLDRVFTANMTGNVVILAMGLVGANGLPVIGPAIALGAFALGAIIAGRVLRGVPKGWSRRVSVLLTVVAAVLIMALVVASIVPTPYPLGASYPLTAMLGVSMGMQAGTARHVGVVDVTTVVVTSTLVGLAFESWLGRRTGQQWRKRLLAVVLIALGALCGAALLLIHFALGLGLATVVVVAVAAVGFVGDRMPTPASGEAASAAH